MTVIELSVADVTEAAMPAGVIWMAGCEPNHDPVIVMLVGGAPTMAEVGVAPAIVGVGSQTVKLTLALPRRVTTMMVRGPPAAVEGME